MGSDRLHGGRGLHHRGGLGTHRVTVRPGHLWYHPGIVPIPASALLYIAELLLQGPGDDRGDARHPTGRDPRTCGGPRRPYHSPDHHSREGRLSASLYGGLVSTSTGRCV
ncbi:hypothetical protein N7499_003076 [Penicillium canescens]|uniref:Uncharacterized protein n=1 Tax=Penicillium canescens TaxID=5083 RepID=A0AAD6ICE3_PENCN|nr:uncharacterized protein N7446_011949 [Penicillium canescens]KAJ6019821.1 hypothetical protein N7522_000529 [Penicillium canescens]KAJ6039116.1 hypothetical protein N7460_007148 [Penicillium canescens]KAJ6047115.1 hypothetical protein N7446_011949 [Penicillium canescens]KAJ6059867.1 hypothetical protein N7444_003506 [Penicillium canescens]KAJ6093745.1 hypothetical protein N7499_003076 [Penicillium canescens]